MHVINLPAMQPQWNFLNLQLHFCLAEKFAQASSMFQSRNVGPLNKLHHEFCFDDGNLEAMEKRLGQTKASEIQATSVIDGPASNINEQLRELRLACRYETGDVLEMVN